MFPKAVGHLNPQTAHSGALFLCCAFLQAPLLSFSFHAAMGTQYSGSELYFLEQTPMFEILSESTG